MTQICPAFGVAPVPTLVSVIFRPDGVVTGAPAAWAMAVVGAKAPASAVTASVATVLANGKARILLLLEIVVAGACLALQSTGIRDGAAGQHADQVGAILRAAVDVAGEAVRRNRQPFERFR